MAVTMLDKPLRDLQSEINDLRHMNRAQDYDINKLGFIMTASRDSLRETGLFQQQLLKQLQQFEISLSDINQILRTNLEQKAQLEQQQQSDNDIEIRAKLMALNAEALECRAAAVQLQQDAQIALTKAAEIEKRANDELARQALERKIKQQEIERNRAAELERRARLEEEERQRLKEREIQRQRQEQERLTIQSKQSSQQQQQQQQQQIEDKYANWTAHDFMHDDQCPQCIIRTAPHALSVPINIKYLKVSETENLLDNQEELISTPLKVKFDSTGNDKQFLLLSMPYIAKRSSHRENVIKIRQPNGIWLSIETNESVFDAHKDKRFVECKLNQTTACAVVSRLKRDKIYINQRFSGKFSSSADSRLTMQWPINVSDTDFHINLRVQPVDLPTFTQFSQHFSHECQGLVAVGPIIDLHFDDVTLLKPIQFTVPILVQGKKKGASIKSTIMEADTTQQAKINSTSQPSQQDIIAQQQQAIFKSIVGEDSDNERLILLYSDYSENTWHVDTNIRLIDSKSRDIVTMSIKTLHTRMIITRCDKQSIAIQQLPTTISILERSLNQRSVSVILRHRINNPNEVCFACCSSQRIDTINNDLEQENFVDGNEQPKELILQEGQLLELRFRGNVLPTEEPQKSETFAFNTYFPYYFQTTVCEIDRYSQHFSPYFYGFVQIFSKQKVLRTITKEIDKKKQQTEVVKQEWYETDVCLAELVIRLPKPHDEIQIPTQKTLPTFVSEGILTPSLFRDITTNLVGDEWRRLARRLGISRIRIEAIEHDYHDEASYYMLLAWFKRVPHSMDKVTLLIHALISINRYDLARDLQTINDEKRQESKASSKDDQLRSFHVPFNRICQREECVRIWKQLARELLLTNEDIKRIEHEYPSKEERCLRSLEQWALKNTQADIPTLARFIRSFGFKTLAREIDSMA